VSNAPYQVLGTETSTRYHVRGPICLVPRNGYLPSRIFAFGLICIQLRNQNFLGSSLIAQADRWRSALSVGREWGISPVLAGNCARRWQWEDKTGQAKRIVACFKVKTAEGRTALVVGVGFQAIVKSALSPDHRGEIDVSTPLVRCFDAAHFRMPSRRSFGIWVGGRCLGEISDTAATEPLVSAL